MGVSDESVEVRGMSQKSESSGEWIPGRVSLEGIVCSEPKFGGCVKGGRGRERVCVRER